MTTPFKHPETAVLHAGYRSDPATGAVAVPIYQTSSPDEVAYVLRHSGARAVVC